MASTNSNLVLFLWHDGHVIGSVTATDPDSALRAARLLLDQTDGLYDGDRLEVVAVPPSRPH
jgi:hypothetical protein